MGTWLFFNLSVIADAKFVPSVRGSHSHDLGWISGCTPPEIDEELIWRKKPEKKCLQILCPLSVVYAQGEPRKKVSVDYTTVCLKKIISSPYFYPGVMVTSITFLLCLPLYPLFLVRSVVRIPDARVRALTIPKVLQKS